MSEGVVGNFQSQIVSFLNSHCALCHPAHIVAMRNLLSVTGDTSAWIDLETWPKTQGTLQCFLAHFNPHFTLC